jgi:hypothetical protein
LILTVNIKLAVIAITSSLALGGTGVLLWQATHKTPNSVTNQAIYTSSHINQDKSINKKNVYSGNLTAVQKKELQEKIQINKALAWLNSQKPEEQMRDEIQSMLNQPEMSVRETKTLTPEIQRKAILYAKLAFMLPEYIELESMLVNTWTGEKSEDPSLEDRFDKLNSDMINNFGKILRPPAVITDDEGNEYVLSSTVMLSQIAEYLGKELPLDGNPDYFSARDYQPERSYNNQSD